MNSNLKTAMFAVAVMAAGYGGYKAYSSHLACMSEKESLVSENVEALSGGGDGANTPAGMKKVVDRYDGYCWYPMVSRTKCKEHSFKEGGLTYYFPCEKTTKSYELFGRSASPKYVSIDDFIEHFWMGGSERYEEWNEERHSCKSPKIKTSSKSKPKSEIKHATNFNTQLAFY